MLEAFKDELRTETKYKTFPMTLSEYLHYFDEMMGPTEALFRLVPPDKIDWKPTEDSFTAGQLMAQIGGALGAYGRGTTTGQWRFSSFEEVHALNQKTPALTVDAAIENFRKNYAFYKDVVGRLTEEEFQSGELDTPQLGRVKRWRIAMMTIEHHLTHKTELFMYLKMLKTPVSTRNLFDLR